MITLNIIPNELKNEIRLKKNYKQLNKLAFMLLAMAIFFSALLEFSKFFLSAQKISEENLSAGKNTENYTKQVNEINAQLKEIKNIQKNNIYWTGFLLRLTNYIGNGIQISQIAISKTDNSLKLAGMAKTRADLLALKDILEKSASFTEINLPISSLLEKENIAFQINTNITNYEQK